MQYNLFIDDERSVSEAYPDYTDWGTLEWVVVRSTQEAISFIEKNGIPQRLALDFNLGYNDNILKFLKEFRKHTSIMPDWRTHSDSLRAYFNIRTFVDILFESSLEKE